MTAEAPAVARSQARKQFLFDLFTTAIEGGINYWAEVEGYRCSLDGTKEDLDGFYATITRSEGDWDGEKRIDIEVIDRGLALFRQQVSDGKIGYPGGGDYFEQLVVADQSDGDDGDYDACGADCVVQLGLFGEVVCG